MLGKEYRAVYKKKRQRYIIVMAAMVIVTIISFIGLALLQWPEKMVEVALIPLVGGVVWLLFDWRCPRCGQSFIRESNPKFCSGCGLQMRGE
jgi:hypothetical protein